MKRTYNAPVIKLITVSNAYSLMTVSELPIGGSTGKYDARHRNNYYDEEWIDCE